MNCCVGPLLLLGLGLCAASGCITSGSNRVSRVSPRWGWQRNNADSAGSRWKKSAEEDSKPTIAFRAPSRRETLDSVADVPSQLNAKNTADQSETAMDLNTVESKSVKTEGVAEYSPIAAGHSSDSRNRPTHPAAAPGHDAAITFAGHETSATASRQRSANADTNIAATDDDSARLLKHGDPSDPVRTANYRSDRDVTEGPVKLLGFETITPSESEQAVADPNEPPLWPDRPNAFSRTNRRTSETGLQTSAHSVGSHSPERVHQASNRTVPTAPAGPWQAEIERLISKAEADLTSLKPGTTSESQAEYRRRHVHLRLLYLMAQRPEQALTVIAGLEPTEQEYWQQLCWAMSNTLDAEQFPTPNDRAAQSIAPLNTALHRLREQADLSIKNMAFCEQISYFGNYQKFARDEFTPGQEVLLYAEIENFSISQTADGEHRTLLRSVIDIVGANGEARWHKTFPATEDRCRNPRRDYFHNYQFAIPDRLPLGPHTLKLTVVDDLSGKQSSYSLNFLVK